MRKRRVFALLLALSLVVSGNGMTVLAAEQGADMPVLATQEESQETDDKLEDKEDTPDHTEQTPETGEQSEETGTPAEGEVSDEDGKTEPGNTPKNPETPESPENPENTENPENPGESDPSVPEEDDAGQNGDQTPVEDDGDVKPEEPVVTPVEEPVGEPGVKEQPVEQVFKGKTYVSRMVTFTDDTGMHVTYDANASQRYIYKVEKGVLTAVTTKETTQDVSGNTIEVETPVKFEGNEELKQPEEGEKYTSIAPSVFAGNQNITYVKLPAGLTSIAAESFKGCTALKGVYVPSTVTEIGAGAFENCTAMTQISVPKAVTSIGESAFKGDIRLHLVYMKDGDAADLRTIGVSAFEGCATLAEFCSDREFVLPVKLESIGEAAFKGCKAIKEVDFTDVKLSALGKHAFEGCTGLTDLSPGEKLTLISEYAFAGCTALSSINFVNGENMTIDSYAFAGCIGLKQMTLPQSVVAVKDYAFQNCTRLTRVELKCFNIEIGTIEAFPGNAEGLVIIAEKDSKGYKYARRNNLLPTENAFYQYTVEDVNGVVMPGGKFPGGELVVTLDLATGADINSQNGGKGVKAGEKCWILYKQATDVQRNNYTFIPGSLRYNGLPMEKEDQKYFFIMPEGGVVITAEFRANTPDKIKGQMVTVEFSVGEPIRNGEQDSYGYLGVVLKAGQATRMFLLDEDGEAISPAKLKFESLNKNIATVSSSGVITAVGTDNKEEANTEIQVKVIGGDGKEFTVTRTVIVKTAEAKSITIKATPYDSDMVIMGDRDGIQTGAINKVIVAKEPYTVKLRANVYDGEDGVGKKLTWTTSDDNVAVLTNKETEAKDPVNVVTIKAGCEGEATITVTANNSADAEKKKVTQKFVIRVYREGYRLASSSITVNPNMKNGGSLELISTSGLGINSEKIELFAEDKMTSTQFTTKLDSENSGDNCKKFHVMPIASTLSDGTYKVRVSVAGDTNQNNFLPLTIIVKRETPKPTIKFNSKKVKFNLFYKDGRSTADGEPTVVTTEITKLGLTEIRDVKLEPLNKNNEDDRLFADNFEVDTALSDFAAGKVIIRRKEGRLKYTSKKKPAVTGNLVIYYEGFEDSAAKKIKVTMPTCTTAPAYALRETKATYRLGCPAREELLEVYDKKSKTKEKVFLSQENDKVTEEKKDIILNKDPEIRDGAIALDFVPEKGQLKLVLRNTDWDYDQNGKERTVSFTYTMNVSNARPTIKTDKASISLNLNYPEMEETFSIVSNQKGIDIGKNQTFSQVSGGEFDKLIVDYTDGRGTVRIKPGENVKKGTYKFECSPQTDSEFDVKKVTLTVKVVDKKPTVKLGKGSLQLNLAAFRNNNEAIVSTTDPVTGYGETAEISFKVNGVPDGYTLMGVGAGNQGTTVSCTSQQGLEEQFAFRVAAGNQEEGTDPVLSVSLKNGSVSKGTYSFSLTPAYQKQGVATVLYANPVKIKVKVYSSEDIQLTLKASGKINLLNREGEADAKNGIIYTPVLKNLSGKITDVKIYDGGSLDKESQYFDIELITEGKNKGKFFVTPKKTLKKVETPNKPTVPDKPTVSGNTTDKDKPTVSGNTTDKDKPTVSGNTTDKDKPTVSGNTTDKDKPTVSENTTDKDKPTVSENTTDSGKPIAPGNTTGSDEPDTPATPDNPDTSAGYEYNELVYNKDYPVRIWVKVDGYAGRSDEKNGVMSKTLQIKASQVLPKATVNKDALDVYLSTKNYDATFVVTPKAGSVGMIEKVYFGEKDEKALESFELIQKVQKDGSLKVIVHLKEGIEYPNGSENDVKMYVRYKGQGIKTPETATSFVMKVRIN